MVRGYTDLEQGGPNSDTNLARRGEIHRGQISTHSLLILFVLRVKYSSIGNLGIQNA
jgi:hypothetical protein